MSFMSVTSLVLVYLLASSLAAPTPIQVYVQLGSVQEPAGYLAAMPAQYDPFGQQQIMGMGMGMTMGAMPMMEQQEVLDSYGEFCSLEGSPVALATKICCDKTNSEYKRSEQECYLESNKADAERMWSKCADLLDATSWKCRTGVKVFVTMEERKYRA